MIARRLIDRLQAETGEDMAYARDVADRSPGGFWKFALMGPLLRHQGEAPNRLWHLARLGAVQVEDCGPCVQTVVTAAREGGVPAETLRAALAGGAALLESERDAYEFGRGVAGEPLDEEVRLRLERAVGERALADLTLAAAAVRIFPALKRGLGYARSCSLVDLEV